MSNPVAELTLAGQAAMQAGRYEDAARAFHEALHLAPETDGLYFQFASALVWRGLPTDALPALDKCAGMGGPWARHAGELATQIRRQLALPVHGMMIMPSGPVTARVQPPRSSPHTTLTGTPASKIRLGADWPAGAEPLPSRVLETIVLRFLARVVHADGVVDPKELDFLLHVAETMELGPAEARRILEDELARKSDPAALARQIAEPGHRRRVYALGCQMAWAEDELAPAEREILDAFARGAGIDEADARTMLAEVMKG